MLSINYLSDTESYTINGTLSDTISDITDLILSFSA